MRRFFFIVVLVAAACAGGTLPGFVNTPECEAIAERLTEEPLRKSRVGLVTGAVPALLTAEVADDEGARSRGLMCRSDVPPGTGMLFQFGGLASGPFWMFNTHVPLDVLYFDQSGRVVGAAAMLPCPREGGESEGGWRVRCLAEAEAYDPEVNYASALELPAGWLRAQGLLMEALPEDLRLVNFGPVNP
ncbi:MAG: DUF192 domain-containing protein [Chloroflexi bacterium]|nr:DUF192 domain-containing protein [Chloroflexota bacterium]